MRDSSVNGSGKKVTHLERDGLGLYLMGCTRTFRRTKDFSMKTKMFKLSVEALYDSFRYIIVSFTNKK